MILQACEMQPTQVPFDDPYRQQDDLSGVTERTLYWFDDARDREVPVHLFIPGGSEGPFPLILFSHGIGETLHRYAYLGRYWAANGYVSMHPNHAGSDARVVKDPNVITPALLESTYNPANWVARPKDLLFILDHLADEPSLFGRIDFERIAVAGHSLGAHSALALSGLRFAAGGGGDRSFRDARVSACLAISPHGPGVLGLDDTSWSGIEIPFMSIYGTSDTDIITKDPSTRRAGFDLATHADRLLVIIDGAEHEAFTGGNPRFPFPSRAALHQSYTAAAATAFLDAYLKHSDNARERLLRGGVEALCDGACTTGYQNASSVN